MKTKASAPFCTALLLLISVSTAFAQTDFRPGYYITWSNDTIHGLIDYRGEARNSKVCSFRENNSDETVTFDPADIKAYRFNDSKYYVSKKIATEEGDQQVFLEFLVDGITNLYYYRESVSEQYLLEDRQGNMYALSNEISNFTRGGRQWKKPSLRYIGVLKANFADCIEIQPELNKTALKHKSLIDVTRKYHECVCDDEQCIIYERSVTKAQVQFAPQAAIGTTFLSFSDNLFSQFTFVPQPIYGIGVLMNTPVQGINEKLSFEFEANLLKGSYHGYYHQRSAMANVDYTANVDLLAINPVAVVKYSLPARGIKPRFGAGVGVNYYLSRDENVWQERIQSDTRYTKEMDGTPLSDFMIGGIVQGGISFLSGDHHEIFTNIRYHYYISTENPKLSESFPKAATGSLWLSAGFYL